MSSSSGIWLNFHRDPTDRNTAICKICQKCLRMTTGTSNLSRHLNIHKRDEKEKVNKKPPREHGYCRCCLSEGNFRIIQSTHQFQNGKPYNYILRTVFNITLTPIKVGNDKITQLICGACELRLSESYDFYTTILKSENTLIKKLLPTINKTKLTDSKRETYLEQLLNTGKSTLELNEADSLKLSLSEENKLNLESIQTNDETVELTTTIEPIKFEPVETSQEIINQPVPKENAIITELEKVYEVGIKIESDVEEEYDGNEKTECESYFEIDKVEHGIDGPVYSGDKTGINPDLTNDNGIHNELTSNDQGLDEVAMACNSIMGLNTMENSNLVIDLDSSDENSSRKRKIDEVSEVEMACTSIMNLDNTNDSYIQSNWIVDDEDCVRKRIKNT